MQKVNLYTLEFQPKRVILPFWQLVMLPLVCLLLLAFVSFFVQRDAQQFAAELSRKQAQAQRLGEQVEALAKRRGSLVRDESLAAANARLQSRLTTRESMLTALQKVVVEEDAGFSEVLIALARQRVDALWLDHIQISGPVRSYGLKGVTRKADSVPTYLQKLRQEPVFVGHAFNLFDLTSERQGAGELQFTLQSKSLTTGADTDARAFSLSLNESQVLNDG